MKAIVCTKYGPPDVLLLGDVEKPTPKDNEVLIRIYAASINAADLELLRGSPFLIRLAAPLRPICKILGSDMAGCIEAVGANVKQFKQGDKVFADLSVSGYGAFSEYVCAPEDILTLKPAGMTFEEAATLPQAAILAVQGLRDKKQIQPGHKVLINGAGGGVGTFAVQIAKHFGAEVTGVDSKKKLDIVHSIGADHVIDYAQEDFTKSGKSYDLIIDVVANRSISDYERALNHGGVCAFVGGSMVTIFQSLILGPRISKTRGKKIGLLMWKPNNKEDLDFLKELLEAGKVVPIIDKCYPLREVPEALKYLAGGNVVGKLVITMEYNNQTK